MQTYEVLEHEWADWNQLNPAGMVVCASGTAALHLALESAQIKPGSFAYVPDYSMVAVARAAILASLEPEFIDCRSDDLCMDVNGVLNSPMGPIGALIAVHNYGRQCQMKELYHCLEGTGAFVVEDLAEAHGIDPSKKTDAACWSFYINKIVHGEEGGAVWFRDPELAKRARSLRSLGFTEEHDYAHIPRGHNYRLSNCNAALVLESIYQAHKNIVARKTVEQYYNEFVPKEWQMPPRVVPWVYDLRIPGMTKDQQVKLVTGLREIGGRYGFKSLSRQQEFGGAWVGHPCCSNSIAATYEVISLPIQPSMSKRSVQANVDKLLKCHTP